MHLDKALLEANDLVISTLGAKIPERISYETDTRLDLSGKAFVALKGESFNGHEFIGQAISKGAKAIIWSSVEGKNYLREIERQIQLNKDVSFLEVENTTSFLQKLAKSRIENWRSLSLENKVIGVAGSNGKTTTKEMIFYLINSVKPGKVFATQGNLNNHLGVPHTILSLENNHQYLVLEMGSNHPGELSFLCDICTPDHGVITNVGLEHMEFFKDEMEVFEEEATIFRRCMESTKELGYFVLNGADPFLSTLNPGLNTIFLARDGNLKLAIDQAELKIFEQTIVLRNENLLGMHNFYNLAAAFTISFLMMPKKLNQLILAAQNFLPKLNRSSWIKKNNKTYFLDAYNANPSSMEASLSAFFAYLEKNKIEINHAGVILGDMNELGGGADEYHRKIGLYLAKQGIKDPIFIGKFSGCYADGFGGENCHIYPHLSLFMKSFWHKFQNDKEYFFIKASRSLQLEKLLDINH